MSQLSSNYKQNNNFATLLECLNFEEGIRADRRAQDENDKEGGGIFNLEIIISGLLTLQGLSDCFS